MHIKLNGSTNAAFRSTPSYLATLPPPTSTSQPPTLLSRPKLIGLRIGQVELFILCPAINQFLRRPNRGRKDQAATRAAKRRTSSRGAKSSNKERVGERVGQIRKTRGSKGRADNSRGGQLTLVERSSDELRRHLILSFHPMMRKMRPRRKINDFAPRRLYRRAKARGKASARACHPSPCSHI